MTRKVKQVQSAEQESNPAETETVTFDNNQLLKEICGATDAHLLLLEKALNIRIDARGNQLFISGGEAGRATARDALLYLYDLLEKGASSITAAEVDAAIRLSTHELASQSRNADSKITLSLQKRSVSPRSPAQSEYLQALQDEELVFGVGPAGTGKTYLAVAHAAHLLLTGKVERIILSRPALEAGERIGFLPGDMKEKIDPYLRPLYDALYDVLHTDFVDRRLASSDIEIAPLAFMRGRTLSRAAVILDEAQNASISQMKMFLTRLGEGSRMVVTGDPSQTDLPVQEPSGLSDALGLLRNVPGVRVVEFSAADVVRHALVAKVVQAYDARDKRLRERSSSGKASAK